MTIEKAFDKIFDKSINSVDHSLFGIDDLKELTNFNNDLFRTELIYEIIRFFANEYDVDLLPKYLEYMSKCNHITIKKSNEIIEGDFPY